MTAKDQPLSKDEQRDHALCELTQAEQYTQKLAVYPAKRPSPDLAPVEEPIAFPASQTWASDGQEEPAAVSSYGESWPAPLPLSQSQTPMPPSQPHAPSQRDPRLPLLVTIALVVLVVLVVGGAFFGPRWLAGVQKSVVTQTLNTPVGPFAAPPYNTGQVNNLLHLANHMQDKQLASLYVSGMTLDEEIGQVIMVEYSDEYYSPNLNYMINGLHVGGVIMYEFQMKTFNQTKSDIAQMQQHAQLPLLVSADEEGGCCVHRLKNIYPLRLGATDIENTGDINVATREGKRVGQELIQLGINVNLDPDLDVRLRDGIDQDTRTFGTTPQEVIKYASPYMKAMQSQGVIACVKHFPGLGDANIDAHAGLPVINRTKDQIYSVELAPFKYFIQTRDKLEHTDMIMPTDLLMPAIDPVWPAELSPTFMTDILRKQLGFDGVSLTDALYMKGLIINGRRIDMSYAGVLALKAGNDMLLGPTDTAQTEDMISTIKQALQDGTLSKARLDEAATRVIALKMQRGLMPATPPM